MKVFVCVKHVPDTAATIKIVGENGFDDEKIKCIINPYDEFAIEEAVSLVGKNGSGEVVIVSVGKDDAVDTLRTAMAMGGDRAILVKTKGQFLDSILTSQAIRMAIEQDGMPDLIFTGKGAVDTEGSQTLYRLGRALSIPAISDVSRLEITGDTVKAERDVGGGEKELQEMKMPAVIGATKGLNEPRYPKFPDILKAKKKEIKEFELEQLGIDENAAKLSVTKLQLAPERASATMIDGSVDEQVSELIRILKEEKVL